MNWMIGGASRIDIVIPLERFEKTDLDKELDKLLGYKPRSVFADIEQTYLNALQRYCQTNIKIETDLVSPCEYKFANEIVEIIPLHN